MNEARLALAALAAATYGVFIWGAYFVFVPKGRPSRKLVLLKVLALAAAVLEVWAITRSTLSPGWLAGGAALYLASLALFGWAVQTIKARPLSLAFCSDLPEHLVQTGPYRWLRHPFYTAYMASYLAGWLGSGQHWLAVVVAAMGAVYLDAGRGEERKFSASPLADQYRHYKESTGALIPRLPAATQ